MSDALITASNGSTGACFHCDKTTANVSLTFETWMCSGNCEREKYREYERETAQYTWCLDDDGQIEFYEWGNEGNEDNVLLRTSNVLNQFSTQELANELARREGVAEYRVDAHGGKATLSIDNGTEGSNTPIDGPARIVVNRD